MYHLQLVTPEKVIFDGEVLSLVAPGEGGYLGVLTRHAPMLVSLKSGTVTITDKERKKTHYAVSKGFLEVNHNQVSIIIEKAELLPEEKPTRQ